MADNIDIDKIFRHWIDSSDKDCETMMHMYESKDYNWSLFIGHIVIEKLIKASIVKARSDHAPFTHGLTKLASLSDLEFSDEQLDWLDTITAFNINARYDSYKQAFYKKCTPEYTKEWIDKILNLRSWIKDRQLK
ncbi:HEPN domain-containing protein [Pontibacter sp. 172403-2]|uniref:HEPN domain-containing protein n=1 Tax=Pontibacter rufus TaxID=2791028 RepID=UPI0018AFADAC|nr:HEPN domain-containing protein [Pontibacter sp. 172403-2]MBF9252388.1 HEPN domain-containing protein [Pontibacter sp. 172403-2]